MYKFFSAVLTAMLFAVIFAMNVSARPLVSIYIEGETLDFADQEPVILEGRTLVPVRGVFEELGFTVDWDGNAQQVTLSRYDFMVILTVGSETFTTNGETFELDVPAQIIAGRTMLPIRAVLESVGLYVGWSNRIVRVSVSPFLPPNYVIFGGRTYHTALFTGFILGGEGAGLALPWHYDDDLGQLRYMPRLTSLTLTDFPITDLSPLAELTNLRRLTVTNTPVSDLTPLAGLTNLDSLVLNDNQISDLTPLAGLVNLHNLHLHNNPVSDLTPLAELPSLRVLHMYGTPVTDWSPVDHVFSITGRTHGNMIVDAPRVRTPRTDDSPRHGIEFEQQFVSHLPDLVPPRINDVDVQVLRFLDGIYRITVSLDDVTLDDRAINPFFFWESDGGTFHDIIDDRETYAQFTFRANPGTAGQNVQLIVSVGDGLGQVNPAGLTLKGNDAD